MKRDPVGESIDRFGRALDNPFVLLAFAGVTALFFVAVCGGDLVFGRPPREPGDSVPWGGNVATDSPRRVS